MKIIIYCFYLFIFAIVYETNVDAYNSQTDSSLSSRFTAPSSYSVAHQRF
jgi:hypothetical protein